jgi:SAM-dependent methyltransferase
MRPSLLDVLILMRELLIGCGNSRRKKVDPAQTWEWDELVTIDHDPNCGADIVHDLEQFPWPVESDSFDAVHAYDVIEHLGRQGDFRSFFDLFAEIYRVLKPGGHFFGIVPSMKSVWVWADPSHTRAIAPETLVFLSREEYHNQIGHTPMTDFRWYWHGDFETRLTHDNGGAFTFALKAHKPARTFEEA